MTSTLLNRLPHISFILLAAMFGYSAMQGDSNTTLMLIAASGGMFLLCWASAIHLLGARAALHFVLIGMACGWFAEQMGASHGWFFGDYDYTTVLGPTLGDVPIVIPLMWFALCYVAYVICNLIVWQASSDGNPPVWQSVVMSLLAAMVVVAYDLGADPYMVFVLKAWIMVKTDGWWFGETLQGFFGWAFVTFVVVFGFRMTLRKWPATPAPKLAHWHVLVPLVVYGGSMVFQMIWGHPVETRTIAAVAMGIPLLFALCGWWRSTQPAAGRGAS
jgi:uncharacterized membrane protein